MNKTIMIAALLSGMSLSALATGAQAQQLRLDERGVRIVPQERERVIIERDGRDRRDRREISRREAIDIAEDNGIDQVERIVSTDTEWRIIGEDRRGRELRVIVDRFSGRVIRRVRVS